ncbi:T9SS type A sorting domain-containing protein [Carboxylicivirga sediminis]|uniref:T9SS type A sorting domain-containing protein n=1 Tax=Carboxylicivirga sediminis TaxID=2006564 RepID=A0A941F5L4_9BACT|nr:T9SS type A sorting domain-containing protein [Carboxylicivirga sediminis]MBR8536887.1 T9SS type A sorting domain-containing protein [Carboxylicivirga sediminis]
MISKSSIRIFLLILLVGLMHSVNAQQTWYTLASGDWDNPDIWTLDPAGAVPVGSAVPAAGDNVVILTGKTVVVPDGIIPYDAASNGGVARNVTMTLGSVKVSGQLDLRESGGHSFAQLKGNGRLLMAADNYPTVTDDSYFVAEGGDEGTAVYYGDSNFNIQTASTFYNLEINLNSGNEVTLSDNYLLNGDLLIKSGQVRLGEASSVRYTVTIKGDVTIQADGELTVRTGDSFGDTESDYHQIICYGNIVNAGIINLTTQNQPDYNTRLTGNGVAAAVLTMAGSSDANFTCNGVTNLYRLILDKGFDQSYKLNLSASSEGNFRLYGCNNQNGVDTKALYLKNGTLVLTGSVFIPTLTEGGSDFFIGATSGLHINGAGVKVYSTARSDAETAVGGVTGTGVDGAASGSKSFSVLGKFMISAGLFETKTHGFVAWDSGNASVIIQGGTVITPGFRSAGGQTGKWSYNQSGGLVQLYGDINSDLSGSGSPTFHIKGSENVFMMSGGTIELFDAATPSQLAIGIESGEGNYGVTGGTIIINRSASAGSTFNVSSTAPLYNLEINSANTQSINLNTSITVKNNLTIGSANSTLSTANNLLEIGGDLTNNGSYSTGSNHVTRFIGQNPSTVNGGTVTFDHLELNKNSEATAVTLGTGTISITKDLTINKGTLDVGTSDRNLGGSIDISYGSIVGSNALILNSTASQQTLKGKVGQTISFGNLKLNNTYGTTPQIKLLSDVDATTVEFLVNNVFDLGAYNLNISSSYYSSGGSWGTSRMFATDGRASNGGLTLPILLSGGYGSGTEVQFFPIGFLDPSDSDAPYLTEVYIDAANNPVDNGSLTIRYNKGNHPTVDDPSLVEAFYWRVEKAGLESVSAADLRYVFSQNKTLSTTGSRRGMVFQTDNTWLGGNATLSNGNRDIQFNFGTPLEKEYSWGRQNGFNNVETLYSKVSGPFNSSSTWTLSPTHSGADATPRSYYMYVIGGLGAENHKVYINDGSDASQVYIKGKTETNIGIGDDNIEPPTLEITNSAEGPLTLDFFGNPDGGNDLSFIRGKGRFLIHDETKMPTVDFTEFMSNDEAIFEYSGTGNYTLPTSTYSYWLGFIPIPISEISSYPNLHITNSGDKTAGNIDLVINGNLFVDDATFNISSSGNGDVTVFGDVIINTGTLSLPASQSRTMDIDGDITVNGAGTLNVATGTTVEHQINLNGNISQGSGTIELAESGGAIISFEGTQTATFSKTSGTSEFYKLEINKPVGQKVDFQAGFTLPTDASGPIKNLVLTSGECHLNSSAININLSTGGNDFRIPSGTILNVDRATVNVGGSASNTGIWLDGSLIINNSGIVNCAQGSNGFTDNYIEYSSSGDASITLNGTAQLSVGSQLRRSLNTDVGVLTFNQAGAASAVKVGVNAAGATSRGLFEITGAGSSFTQAANSKLTIIRGHGATNKALLFDPESVNIGSGAGFIIGDNTTPAGQIMAIYAGSELGDLTIEGTNAPSAVLNVVPATINGNLAINSGEFDANGLDVILKGNLFKDAAATYNPNNNTTYFEGVDQTITGDLTFANLIRQTGTGALTLDASSPVLVTGNMELLSGTLNTGDNDLTLYGDLFNEVTTTGTGGQGIIMAGSDIQELGGTGQYYRLTINNANGVALPTQSGALTFTNQLRLVDGVFDIGRNLLIFNNGASIEPVNPFSSSNMIQTNLSFTDNGIKKYFPVISAAESFTYPIGSLGKYTPVIFDITTNGGSTGAIRVKAADEPHISIPLADQANVLQYNWTLDAEGIQGFSGLARMYSNDGDALGDTSQYITARILLGSTDWNKFTTDEFQGKANADDISLFYFSNTDDAGIDGDYTAGVSSSIPDQVPSYTTVVDGNYSDVSTWATYDPDTGATGAAGVGIPAGGPRGSLIYINHYLSFPDNFEAAYRTFINATGTANIGSSFGHRLGDVYGVGKVRVERGDLPAGAYDEFFSETGGTLEYSGTGDYDILSELPLLNNLVLSGSGERRLPNVNVQLYGDWTIDGPDVINTHNSNLYLKGDLSFAAGTFDAGIGTSTLGFNGIVNQYVNGALSFTSAGGGALYSLEVNNPVGIQVSNDLEVDKLLLLTDGIIVVDASSALKLTDSDENAVVGASASSYVDGLLKKEILSGGNFDFPVGNASRYGNIEVTVDGTSGGEWSVRYYNTNPSSVSRSPESFVAPVEYVSHNEFWHITAPNTSAQANLLLRWDSGSGVTPDNDFRVVKWNATAWEEVNIGTKSGTTASGTVNLSTDLLFSSSEHYLTFGSIIIPAFDWEGGLSGDWFDPLNWSDSQVPVASSNVTITNTGTAPFVKNTSEVAQVNDLTINHTGGLTIQPGAQMTVNGTLITNDQLFVENTNTQPASLITHGNVTGDVSFKWTYDNLRWWFIAHPIANPVMASYDAIIAPNDYVMYEYLDGGINRISKTAYNFTAQDEIKGYMFKVKEAGAEVMHTGTINAASSYSTSLLTDWQIIGNPYPSYYQLPKETGVTADFANTTGTVYVTVSTRNSDKTFETYNTLTGLSSPETFTGVIAPSQAFYVQTEPLQTGQVTMRASNRIHDVNKVSLKSTVKELDVLRVKLSNGELTDEAVIALRDNGDIGLSRLDSKQRFVSDNSLSYIYSVIDQIPVVINVLPQSMVDKQVTLGIKPKYKANHTIHIDGLNSLVEDYQLFLEDKKEQVTVEMTANSEYTFEADPADKEERFVLRFKEPKTELPTDIGEGTGEAKEGVKAYIQNGTTLVVECEWKEELKQVMLYTISGRLVVSEEFRNERFNKQMSIKPGVYLLKVIGQDKAYEQKLFVD